MVSGLKVERPGGTMTQDGYNIFCSLTGRYQCDTNWCYRRLSTALKISILNNVDLSWWAWQCRPLFPGPGRQKQADFYVFKDSLVYIHSELQASQPPCLEDRGVLKKSEIYSGCIYQSPSSNLDQLYQSQGSLQCLSFFLVSFFFFKGLS